MSNYYCNQSLRRSNEIFDCVTFIFGGDFYISQAVYLLLETSKYFCKAVISESIHAVLQLQNSYLPLSPDASFSPVPLLCDSGEEQREGQLVHPILSPGCSQLR